ncbi:MAG: phospholipase D-like domain-containing protein [Aggregatilineales bacterium]
MPQHDIIDNRHEVLIDRIKDFLPHSQAADFTVGYFFLSGFKAIATEIAGLNKLRLLIGNTTNRETLEQIVEGYGRLDHAQRRAKAERMNAASRAQIHEETARTAREALSLMAQDDVEEQSALSLARGIAEGRIEVRLYTKGRLHAKAYIFDFKQEKPYDGAGIIGSSNFSLGGIIHNTELNASLDGNANHAALKTWFEELWVEAEDFSAALIKLIEDSWVLNPVTPYDIYLKTLWTLVRDRLEDTRHARLLWEAEMPPLADFQRIAVEQARRILSIANGVFISDVVGFGKTYIGAALLKHWNLYENAYALVICPRALVPMWEQMLARYGIWGDVISMGLLSQREDERLLLDNPKYSNAGIVLIDESHNLRSPDTQRYQTLVRFTQTRPCILLTATPRNTSAWDVYYQVKLWHPDDRTTLLDPPAPPLLSEFFNQVQGVRPNGKAAYLNLERR